MAIASMHAALTLTGARQRPGRLFHVVLDYWALTKPEILFLISITTAAGFWMSTAEALTDFPWLSFVHAVLGTALVAAGAAALNQLIELPDDARMHRTARRPLPSGRIASAHALWFGVVLSIGGLVYLNAFANKLAAALAAYTLVGYLFLYTPLKKITPLATLVGAIPGAAPPLIGWAAARGHLDPAAWALFTTVFLWQFPHFTSIVWMYREDYARADYRVLPRGERRNQFVMLQTVIAAAALLLISGIPTLIGLSGFAYFVGALALGGTLLHYSVKFVRHKTNATARQLLFASIVYLPVLFALLVIDKL